MSDIGLVDQLLVNAPVVNYPTSITAVIGAEGDVVQSMATPSGAVVVGTILSGGGFGSGSGATTAYVDESVTAAEDSFNTSMNNYAVPLDGSRPMVGGLGLVYTVAGGGSLTDVIEYTNWNGEPYNRFNRVADGSIYISNPQAPMFVGHTTSPIASGSDTNFRIEEINARSSIFELQFARTVLTDTLGNQGYLNFPPTFPMSGAGVLSFDDASAFASTGTGATLKMGALGNQGTATIAWTGKSGNTLTGVTATSVTTPADVSARHGIMLRDPYYAPIFTVSDFNGALLTDKFNAQNAIATDATRVGLGPRAYGTRSLWALLFGVDSGTGTDFGAVDSQAGLAIFRNTTNQLATSAQVWVVNPNNGSGLYVSTGQVGPSAKGGVQVAGDTTWYRDGAATWHTESIVHSDGNIVADFTGTIVGIGANGPTGQGGLSIGGGVVKLYNNGSSQLRTPGSLVIDTNLIVGTNKIYDSGPGLIVFTPGGSTDAYQMGSSAVSPVAAKDNAVDLGVSGTNRWRTGYFGTSVNIGGNTAAVLTNTLDQFGAPAAAVSWNSQNLNSVAKVNVANGSTYGTVQVFNVGVPAHTDNTAYAMITSDAAGHRGLVVQGQSAPSVPILDIQNSSGTTLFSITGGTIAVVDGATLNTGTTTGMKFGSATTQKIGFWNATPIVQPARVGQLTDNSTGTSGGNTIGAVTTVATAANAIATLAAKVNALELLPHNVGLTA